MYVDQGSTAAAIGVLATVLRDTMQARANGLADVAAYVEVRATGPGSGATSDAAEAAATIVAMASREARLPSPRPQAMQLLVFVHDTAGAPLAGYRIALESSGSANLPSGATTGDGYALITVRSGEFPGLADGGAQLFLTVSDAQGRQVYVPSHGFLLAPGTLQIIDVEATA